MNTFQIRKLVLRSIFFVFLIIGVGSLNAANTKKLITIVPENPTLDEPVSIIYDATQGNGKFIFFDEKIYAHTGVTTDNGTWQYATNWGGALEPKHQLISMGDNKWRLDMPEGIRKFYNVAAPDESIYSLCFVFRSEDGLTQDKGADDKDIFFNLMNGYNVQPKEIYNLNQPITITFDPSYYGKDFGTETVYAHTGLITNESTSDTNWKYDTTWGNNSPKYQLEKKGKNYILNLPDGIQSYYNIPSSEIVKKLAFVLRNGAGNNSTENIYVEVNNPLVKSSVAFPNEAESFDLIFNLGAGNKGLQGYDKSVYIHTGVITDKSKDNSDWLYATDWKTISEKQKLTKIGEDFYKISFNDVRAFYDVPAEETIKSLVFVLRDASGDKQGKTADDADILVPLYTLSATNLKVVAPTKNKIVAKPNEEVFFRAESSTLSTITLTVAEDANKDKSVTNTTALETALSFANAGIYTVTITAEDISKTVEVEVLGTTEVAKLPKGMKPGINYHQDATKATLVLQAPYKNNVNVIGDFNDWTSDANYAMKRDGEMFWLELENLTVGEEYAFQYVIDGNIVIADPYTDKVLDPAHDRYINEKYDVYPNLKEYPAKAKGIVSVLQTGQIPFQWEAKDYVRPSKDHLMIYEIHLRDFTEEGTYKAALAKLPYIKELGINAIELMPINEFEGNDSWGYNPSFYFAVDKAYGTKNYLKHFIDECHKEGIAVILDMVLNHSFGQSPLFQMYKDTDGKPSNHNPWYNKNSNFTNPDAQWGVDFNHESFYTRALVDSVSHFWLKEYQFDGIRYDFTKGFSNTPHDDWGSNHDPARVYNIRRMAERVQEISPNAYVILEHLTPQNGREEQEIADGNLGIMTWRNMTNAYAQGAMGHKTGSDFRQIFDKDQSVNMPDNSIVGYMESHDEERITYKAEQHGAGDIQISLTQRMKQHGTCAAFFLTIPGPKMIWQFGELGYDFSIDENGRTGRKPIKWDYYDDVDRKALYDTYAKLLHLRKSYPQLFNVRDETAFQWYVKDENWDDGRKLFARANDGSKMVIVGNFTGQDKEYDLYFPEQGQWVEYMSNTPLLVTADEMKVQVGANDFKLFINFDVPVKDIYTSDLKKSTSLENYANADKLRLRAGGWKDANIAELNTFLNTRNEDLYHTTLDMTIAELVPSNLDGVFNDSKNITSVFLADGDYTGVNLFNSKSNPNTLLYTTVNTTLNTSWNNVVNGGKAQANVVINDAYPFHFAQDFEVSGGKKTSYLRNMKSAHKAGGWYTIALPFEPTHIETDFQVGQNIRPVTDIQSGDFWLRAFTGSGAEKLVGFENVPTFEANRPYIIAFPGKDWGAKYPEEWNVTFSTTSPTFFDSGQEMQTLDGEHIFNFYGTIKSINDSEKLDRLYTLDVAENKFKKGIAKAIKPFYAYFEDVSDLTLRNMSLGVASRQQAEEANEKVEIVPEKEDNKSFVVYGATGAIVINTTQPHEVFVHSMAGSFVTHRTLPTKGEYTIFVPRGLYILNQQKVFVK